MHGNPNVGKAACKDPAPAGKRLQARGPCGSAPEHRLEERGRGRHVRDGVWHISVPRERVRGAGGVVLAVNERTAHVLEVRGHIVADSKNAYVAGIEGGRWWKCEGSIAPKAIEISLCGY